MRRIIEVEVPIGETPFGGADEFSCDFSGVEARIRSELSTLQLPLRPISLRVELSLGPVEESGKQSSIRIVKLKSLVWGGETL